jgi:hypothetical protein
MPLLTKAGAPEALDGGFTRLKSAPDCEKFVVMCRKLRFWDRAVGES